MVSSGLHCHNLVEFLKITDRGPVAKQVLKLIGDDARINKVHPSSLITFLDFMGDSDRKCVHPLASFSINDSYYVQLSRSNIARNWPTWKRRYKGDNGDGYGEIVLVFMPSGGVQCLVTSVVGGRTRTDKKQRAGVITRRGGRDLRADVWEALGPWASEILG